MLKLCPKMRRGQGAMRKSETAKQDYNSPPAERVVPTLAPLQGVRWKNFPDLLTSQPCHLPTAAWIQNAALNPCPAGRE